MCYFIRKRRHVNMSHFHRIKTLKDQRKLLEEMLMLETKIRAQKEAERLVSSSQHNKYTKIFEPITNTMKDLGKVESFKPKENPGPSQPQEDLMDFNTDATIPDVMDFEDPKTAATSSKLSMNRGTVKQKWSDVLDDMEIKDENDDSLFQDVWKNIPVANLDDGKLGLNVKTFTIDDNPFIVKGNMLIVKNANGSDKESFIINNRNVWTLLLAMRPHHLLKLKSNGKYIPAVKEYANIIQKLGILDKLERNKNEKRSYRTRSKFKLLQTVTNLEKKGKGFLFSIDKPQFLKKETFKPSTVIIPSDKKGLLRALVKALAELRAGNTSMRNLVVPLAQEAKRKKILPQNLLSVDEETWVFA